MALKNSKTTMSWFTELEEVPYSILQYFPSVGTIYSQKQAAKIYNEHEWLSRCRSVANSLESSFTDITVYQDYNDAQAAVFLHPMAEPITDKVFNIFHHTTKIPQIKVSEKLEKGTGYVLVAESTLGMNGPKIFEGKAKGVHHFYGSAFTGTLTEPHYAPKGENIRLNIPFGLYHGAQVTFTWKWTKDAYGKSNSPTATLGFIRLEAGTPTRFGLWKRKGPGWQGYDFWGQIKSKDQIIATTRIQGKYINIDFKRIYF